VKKTEGRESELPSVWFRFTLSNIMGFLLVESSYLWRRSVKYSWNCGMDGTNILGKLDLIVLK
jgi:hypothetical protein